MAKVCRLTPSRLSSDSKIERIFRLTVEEPNLQQRPNLRALFLGFSSVGLSGFGGVLPFARRMLVEERQWMSAEEFNAQLGLCQFLPGPNVVNLAVVVGKRYRGLPGALVSAFGLLAGPFVIVLLLALLYDHYGSLPQVQAMLRGIAAVGCGLLFFLPFTGLTVVAIAGLRWPMPSVMVVGLLLSGGVAYWALGRK